MSDKKNNFDLYYKVFLLVVFLSFWGWSVWHPTHQQNWLLENKAVFFSIPVVYFLFIWYIKFSRLSLTLVTAFVLLHLVGAHYDYGSVPFGKTLGSLFNSKENMYDKLVHFSFGLLIAYPLREMFLRIAKMKGFWSYLSPFMAIITLGTFYEIYEWVTVLQYDPQIGYLFIGGNDPFDTTKDLFSALLGSLIALLLVAWLEKLAYKDRLIKSFKKSFVRDKRTYPKEDEHIHKVLEKVA